MINDADNVTAIGHVIEIANINPAGNVIAVHDMNEFRNFGYQMSPRNYIIDFETGLISALLNLYMTSIQDGLVIIRGCHFHYAQCLIRNIKSRKVLFVHYDEHVTNIAAYLDNPNLVNLHNNSALLDPMNNNVELLNNQNQNVNINNYDNNQNNILNVENLVAAVDAELIITLI